MNYRIKHKIKKLKPWMFQRIVEMEKRAENCIENYNSGLPNLDNFNFENWGYDSFAERFNDLLTYIIMKNVKRENEEIHFDDIDHFWY